MTEQDIKNTIYEAFYQIVYVAEEQIDELVRRLGGLGIADTHVGEGATLTSSRESAVELLDRFTALSSQEAREGLDRFTALSPQEAREGLDRFTAITPQAGKLLLALVAIESIRRSAEDLRDLNL